MPPDGVAAKGVGTRKALFGRIGTRLARGLRLEKVKRGPGGQTSFF